MKKSFKHFYYLLALLIPAIAIAALPTRIENGVIVDPYMYPKTTGNLLGTSTQMWDAWLRKINGYTVNAPLLDSSLSTAHIYLGDANSVAQKVAPTGDVTINSAGVTAIGAGKISNVHVNAAAAIEDTKLATIQTAGKVLNSATSATAANTANAIMARDAVGQVAASTFTGNLVGDVTGTASGNPPNSRTFLPILPMFGGGDFSADRTFGIYQATASSDGYLSSSDWSVFNNKVPATRTVGTSLPLYGGGDLSSNRTLAIYQATGSSDGYLASADWTTFNAKVATTRTINTTLPLAGGGDLSSDRTLTIADASTTASGVVNTSTQGFAGLKNFQQLGLGQTTVSSTGNIDALDTSVRASFRLTGASPTLRGIANGADGKLVIVVNVTGVTVTVKNDDSTPTAANRILTGTGSDLSLADTASILIQYDNTTERWRVVGGSGGGSGSGTSTTQSVAQTSHGFAVGDWLYHTGSSYAKAKADADSTSEVLGVVSVVPTANAFTLTTNGYVNTLSGKIGGSTYYLSATIAAGMSTAEPTAIGYISKPVFVADSATSGYVIHSRGQVITSNVNTKIGLYCRFRTTSPTWNTSASGTYVGFGATGSFSSTTLTSGYATPSLPATTIPGGKCSTLDPGVYKVTFIVEAEGTSSGTSNAFSIYDGSTNSSANVLYTINAGSGLTTMPQVVGTFVYTTTQTNIQFELQCKTDGSAKGCYLNNNFQDFEFIVERIF